MPKDKTRSRRKPTIAPSIVYPESTIDWWFDLVDGDVCLRFARIGGMLEDASPPEGDVRQKVLITLTRSSVRLTETWIISGYLTTYQATHAATMRLLGLVGSNRATIDKAQANDFIDDFVEEGLKVYGRDDHAETRTVLRHLRDSWGRLWR